MEKLIMYLSRKWWANGTEAKNQYIFFLLAKKVEIYLAKKVDQTNKETLGMHFIILFKSWKKVELKKKKSWKDLKAV